MAFGAGPRWSMKDRSLYVINGLSTLRDILGIYLATYLASSTLYEIELI